MGSKTGILLCIFVWGCLLGDSAESSDYCSMNCAHIGCGNDGSFGPSCPADAHVISISMDRMAKIVHAHNSRRNLIAGGELAPFKSAVRMAVMCWDSELANLALLNVKKCQAKHDVCHNTTSFKFPGQNIAWKRWKGGGDRDEETVILKQIESWFAEKDDTTVADILSCPSNTGGRQIGHFTEMVKEENTHLGCGSVRYTDKDGYTNILTACNYAFTNIFDTPIYNAGIAASKCTTGTNSTYRNLCSTKEVYSILS